jgi:RNA polymerase sigma-70 factor (ECF subfamily)
MLKRNTNQSARVCAYSYRTEDWGQFVAEIFPVMAVAARRVSAIWGEPLDPAVNEIIQETFVKLCEDDRRILREFEDRGEDSVLKLIRVITASIATDYFRRQRAEKRGGRSSIVPLHAYQHFGEAADPTATEAIEWPVLVGQLDLQMRKVPHLISARDRSLFWLYYRYGLSAAAISRIPAMRLTAKGVESALNRCSRVLREQILDGRRIPEELEGSWRRGHRGKRLSSVAAIDSLEHR